LSRFSIDSLPLESLTLVGRQMLGDSRGYLARLFCADELKLAGWYEPIAQINHTFTEKKGTVRGLHFQHAPYTEKKLVSCIRGEVWDVALDLRVGSKTYMTYHAERLSATNGKAMLIPEGFAHGFQSLSDNVELLYCHSKSYNAAAEAGLNPADPQLAIEWPLAITEISDRDNNHPMLDKRFKGLDY